MGRIYLTLGGYAAAAILGWLYLDARDAIIEEREGCNVANLEAALASSEAARLADSENHKREIQNMLQVVEASRRARAMAEDAAELAESRASETRTIIRKVADTDACLNTTIDTDILNSLRD